MPIMLVSSAESGTNIFPEMVEKLSAEISDAEFQYFFAPLDSDIPMQVKEVISSAELVFVFLPYEKADFRHRAILEKLIDLELESGVKIVKAFERREGLSEMSEEEKGEFREEMAEKWSAHVLKVLFEPDSFKPESEGNE